MKSNIALTVINEQENGRIPVMIKSIGLVIAGLAIALLMTVFAPAHANSVNQPVAYSCGPDCILPALQPPETDMAYMVNSGRAERSSSAYHVQMGKPASVDIASTDECFVSISPFNSGKSLTKVANYHLYNVEVDIQAIGAARGMCLPEVKHTLKLACGTKKVSVDLTFFDTCQIMVRPKK